MSRNRNLENLISLNARQLLLNQNDTFDNKQKVAALKKLPLHIYLICRSPKILIDIDKSKITKRTIKLNFYSNIGGIKTNIPISIKNNIKNPVKEIKSNYPYNYYQACFHNDKTHSEGKTSLLFKQLCFQNNTYNSVSDLEVLYVGQAFGKDGKRITFDRLKSHEKAQKIYYDTQDKFPDYEIWFLSLTFEPTLMTVFDPRTFYNPDLVDEDIEHVARIESNPISLDQQITILEAALIRYFGTSEFNKEYLDFPSSKHTSYSDVYDLDFNSVGFELSTHSILTRLFSKNVKPDFAHYDKYFLHNDSERKAIFHWMEEDV